MNNAILISALIVATVFAVPEASARMGETLAQSDQRYGVKNIIPYSSIFGLSGPGVTNRAYLYQGWRIKTAFIQGRAAMLQYSKQHNEKIQDDEALAILQAEASGGEWTEVSQLSLNPLKHIQNMMTAPRLWTNSNGIKAYFNNPQYMTLVVESPEVDQYKKAQAEAAEQKRKASIPNF